MAQDSKQSPPFRLGDRFDLLGVAAGLLVAAALLLAGLSVWLTIVFACATVNLGSFALRRRAGVPQATVWQRARQRRHEP